MDSDADVGVELSDIVSGRSSPEAADVAEALVPMEPMEQTASPLKKGKKRSDSKKRQKSKAGKKKGGGKAALSSSHGDHGDAFEDEAVLFDERGDGRRRSNGAYVMLGTDEPNAASVHALEEVVSPKKHKKKAGMCLRVRVCVR